MPETPAPDALDRLLAALTASAAATALVESRLSGVEASVQAVQAELAKRNAIEEARARQSGALREKVVEAASSRPAMALWVTLAYALASLMGLDPGPVLRGLVGAPGE